MKAFLDGSTVKRYDLSSKQGEGWATIVLGPDGFFAADSDFGGYAYSWPWNEPGDFREMFLSFDGDYILRKIARTEYDGEATAKAIRKRICELRRNCDLSRADARDEWELLKAAGDVYSEHDYVRWYEETVLELDSEFTRERYPVHAERFVNEIIPRLREMLRAELAAEKQAA